MLELGVIHYLKISGEAVMPLRWLQDTDEYSCRRHAVSHERNAYELQLFQGCELETEESHKTRMQEDRVELAKILRKNGILITEDPLMPVSGLPS